MKKFRGTFIALAIVLVLAAYIVLTEREKPATGIGESVIFGATPDTVEEISIIHGKSKVTVMKGDNGTWVITAPRTYETSQEAVKSLIHAIAEAEFDKEIESDPSALEVFGLDAPDTCVEVKVKRGNKKTLLIGSATPVGSGYYARLTDDSKVCVIGMTLADALSKTADDLRERKIIKASNESVSGIRIVRRTEDDLTDVICEKQGDAWYLVRPIVDKADKERLDELLRDITGLTVDAFVDDEGSDLSRWGFDQPRMRIDLTITGKSAPIKVFIGDPDPSEEGFYVKTEDSAAVYLVKPWTFLPLELTPPDLVDSQLAGWDHDEVITATWTLDGKTFSLLKDGNGWKSIPVTDINDINLSEIQAAFEAPVSDKPVVTKEEDGCRVAGASKSLTSLELDNLVTRLQDIRIIGVGETLGSDIDLAAYGLDNPSIWVQLNVGDGSIFGVKVGKEIEGGFYAIATDRAFVYLVEKEGIEALNKVLLELSP